MTAPGRWYWTAGRTVCTKENWKDRHVQLIMSSQQVLFSDLYFGNWRDEVCDFGLYSSGGGLDARWCAHRLIYVNERGAFPNSVAAVRRRGSFSYTEVTNRGKQAMSDIKTETFKMAIGSPTNTERTYLVGDGVFVGTQREILVHALPVYRQKDYPNYQVRKQGPYVVTLYNSGLRISATAQKLVFPKMEDAVKFAEVVSGLFDLYGLPVRNSDPRTVLEKAKELKEQVFDPMKQLAEANGAVFIEPQK